jgi:2-polyprenyl-3-methyl-5-hydroxy-6-metoxy-1,4-benzoquinol methylase
MPTDRISNHADFLLYERSAPQYDRVRFAGIAGRWGHARQVEILKSLADTWTGKRVLEIGCGTGRITAELVHWGADVTAADISEEMLRVAAARFDGVDPSRAPRFRVMSVFDIDVDLREYDLVVMINVMGRLSNAGEAIRGIASKMSPQGRLIFTFPCLTSVLFAAGLVVNLKGRSLTRDVTSRWYSPRMIEDLCRSAGLEVVRFRGNHYVPAPRLLFPTLPFFWACDRTVGRLFPHRCPSVFADCRLAAGDPACTR